jgi:RND superfamily putative drug exporter
VSERRPDLERSNGRGTRFADAIVRYRLPIALTWLVTLALLVPLALRFDRTVAITESRVARSESNEVDERLATEFGARAGPSAVLVASGVPLPDTDEGRALLNDVVLALRRVPEVTRVTSYLGVKDSLWLARGGTFLVVGLTAAPRQDAVIERLRSTTHALERNLRARYPAVSLAWTGAPAFNYDVRLTATRDAAQAERRSVPLAILLLLLAFGSMVAALLPIGVGAVSILISLGIATLLSAHSPLSILLRNIVSMIGLGVGVDYALLAVSRFREALHRGASPRAAASETVRRAGHTVAISGISVAIGFAALTLVPSTDLHSIAVGGMLVIGCSVLLATTLLPGALSLLGHRIDAWRIAMPRRGGEGSAHWRRWGGWVSAHPWLVLVIAGAPMASLAWESRRLSTDIPGIDWLPERMESARGAHALIEMGRSGIVQQLRVLLILPPDARALTPVGWDATRRLSESLSADPRVQRVRSLPTLTHAARPSATLLSILAPELRASYLSRDERTMLIEVIPHEGVPSGELMRFTRELRKRPPPALPGVGTARVLVGGLPALDADYQDAVASRLPMVIELVVAATFVALFVGFRSLLIPIKALALNLLTVAAAFGAAVLVFQDGHGAHLMGLREPLSGLFPAVPAIVFCTVFGLSMDYEVFLVARVAEAHRSGLTDDEAIAEGLGRTGGVITSAASIMLVVFAASAAGEFLIIKVLGFTLAVAVVLDATLVRIAIGPALLRLAGQWNWWPGERAAPRRQST